MLAISLFIRFLIERAEKLWWLSEMYLFWSWHLLKSIGWENDTLKNNPLARISEPFPANSITILWEIVVSGY